MNTAQVDVLCHRRRRGPYTGTGSLLRRIVPELLARDVELVAARSTEITSIAPELAALIPLPPQTLTNLADHVERTRFYPAERTQRLAHGVAELLTDWARACRPGGAVIRFGELDDADPTDRELVTTLIRRCDPAVLSIHVEPVAVPAPTEGDEAQRYIDSDNLDPAFRPAYLALEDGERARRHSARAAQLEALDQPSLRLGAIPFHAERGVDPAGAGGAALKYALERCFDLGFYEASMELSARALAVVTLADQPRLYCHISHKIAACLAYLGRCEESVAYFAELRRVSIDPLVHMNSNYMMAMLYTRFLPKEQHDEDLALEWVNAAIVNADALADPKHRVFSQAFMRNGRALIELHRGEIELAISLVDQAIELTDRELGPDEQLLHRSVLRYNRAQVMATIGQHAGALADINEVIRRDPDYGDYYFDRAAILRAFGRHDEALADYATAIRLCPPFYEAHYNRADLLRELGDDQAALADLNYALELEPGHVDSLLNRAGVLLSLGEVAAARADIDHGLRLEPQNAGLLCAQGELLAETGEGEAAWASYSGALALDPELVSAWANRAVLAYTTGRPSEAVHDLNHALELSDDPLLHGNRALALQDLGEHRRALADLDLAVAAIGLDDPDLLYRRGLSRNAIEDVDGARADWRAHLAAYGPEDSPFLAEIRRQGGADLIELGRVQRSAV
jgi:tetratricopeptide (TPR) repeat protein